MQIHFNEVPFVLEAYRERLVHTDKKTLRQEIAFLSESYGEYVHFSKEEDGTFEAVFSPEPGYLLGETIASYFGKPSHLIFCESYSDTEALLVVVKEAHVCIDAVVQKEHLQESFASLLTSEEEPCFLVYVQGDLPFSESPQEGCFSLPKENTQSFHVLEDSVLHALRLESAWQLISLEEGFSQLRLHAHKPWVVPGIVILLGMVLLTGWFGRQENTNPPSSALKTWQQTSTQITASEELKSLSHVLATLYTLPVDWTVQHVQAKHQQVELSVLGRHSNLDALSFWASQHEAVLHLKKDAVVLSFSLTPSLDASPPKTQSQEITRKHVRQKLERLFPELPEAFLDPTEGNDNLIRIPFTEVTPQLLILLGKLLEEEPVVLNTLDSDFSSGLLSGHLTLNIIGH